MPYGELFFSLRQPCDLMRMHGMGRAKRLRYVQGAIRGLPARQ
jgi:hypothetical protein